MAEGQGHMMAIEQVAYFLTMIEERARTARESLVLAEHMARKHKTVAVTRITDVDIAAHIGASGDAETAVMIGQMRQCGQEAVSGMIEAVQTFVATGRQGAKQAAAAGTQGG